MARHVVTRTMCLVTIWLLAVLKQINTFRELVFSKDISRNSSNSGLRNDGCAVIKR